MSIIRNSQSTTAREESSHRFHKLGFPAAPQPTLDSSALRVTLFAEEHHPHSQRPEKQHFQGTQCDISEGIATLPQIDAARHHSRSKQHLFGCTAPLGLFFHQDLAVTIPVA